MREFSRSLDTAAHPATPPPIYRLKNTDAAAYLICFHRMRYLDARPAGGKRHDVQFLLDDPNGLAKLRVRDFTLGAPAPVDPRALLQTHSFLRSEIQRVRAAVANDR